MLMTYSDINPKGVVLARKAQLISKIEHQENIVQNLLTLEQTQRVLQKLEEAYAIVSDANIQLNEIVEIQSTWN